MGKSEEQNTLLFIGGTADGKRLAVSGFSVIIPVIPRATSFDFVCDKPRTQQLEADHYQLEEIHTRSSRFQFMVLSGMNFDDAMTRLIQNYRPN